MKMTGFRWIYKSLKERSERRKRKVTWSKMKRKKTLRDFNDVQFLVDNCGERKGKLSGFWWPNNE